MHWSKYPSMKHFHEFQSTLTRRRKNNNAPQLKKKKVVWVVKCRKQRISEENRPWWDGARGLALSACFSPGILQQSLAGAEGWCQGKGWGSGLPGLGITPQGLWCLTNSLSHWREINTWQTSVFFLSYRHKILSQEVKCMISVGWRQ